MGKVQKPTNCEFYAPLSEPFRTNFILLYFRLEHAEGLSIEEENLGETGRPNFLSNVSVPHQVRTEERMMEIVKVNRHTFFSD
jgi:hypothetical protein